MLQSQDQQDIRIRQITKDFLVPIGSKDNITVEHEFIGEQDLGDLVGVSIASPQGEGVMALPYTESNVAKVDLFSPKLFASTTKTAFIRDVGLTEFLSGYQRPCRARIFLTNTRLDSNRRVSWRWHWKVTVSSSQLETKVLRLFEIHYYFESSDGCA